MKNLDADKLGQNIARLRRLQRLTQRQLAEQLHTDPSMITRWEKGKVQPRVETLERLAEVLGVPVEELMLGPKALSWSGLAELDDPDLHQMLTQVSTLEPRDRDALKAVLEAMLTRTKLKSVMNNPGQNRQAS